MEKENFLPLWKEKSSDSSPQYRFEDGKWLKTNEDTVYNLWIKWVEHDKASRYVDEQGYTVYGLKTN